MSKKQKQFSPTGRTEPTQVTLAPDEVVISRKKLEKLKHAGTRGTDEPDLDVRADEKPSFDFDADTDGSDPDPGDPKPSFDMDAGEKEDPVDED